MSYFSPGSRIAVVSPSWGGIGEFPERYEYARRWFLESREIELVLMPHAARSDSHVSSTPLDRAHDINLAFSSKEYDGVWASIGGDHCISTLEYLDHDVISRNPKPFIGYSDISILCNYLYYYCDVPAIHGPSILNEFAEYPEPLALTHNSFDFVFLSDNRQQTFVAPQLYTDATGHWGGEPRVERVMKNALAWELKRGTEVSGTLFGGCLESLRQLLGTKWQPCLTGQVLFLEDEFSESGIANIERDCTHLKNAGIFEDIQGLILGRWYGLDQEQQNQANDLVATLLSQYEFPILCNVDIGHCDPQLFLPLGWDVRADHQHLSLTRP